MFRVLIWMLTGERAERTPGAYLEECTMRFSQCCSYRRREEDGFPEMAGPIPWICSQLIGEQFAGYG